MAGSCAPVPLTACSLALGALGDNLRVSSTCCVKFGLFNRLIFVHGRHVRSWNIGLFRRKKILPHQGTNRDAENGDPTRLPRHLPIAHMTSSDGVQPLAIKQKNSLRRVIRHNGTTITRNALTTALPINGMSVPRASATIWRWDEIF